jgi:hypothetical protein
LNSTGIKIDGSPNSASSHLNSYQQQDSPGVAVGMGIQQDMPPIRGFVCLRKQNFGTAVLSPLLLQHPRLTIVRDSPCVAVDDDHSNGDQFDLSQKQTANIDANVQTDVQTDGDRARW